MTHSTPGANLGTPAHGAPSDAKLLQEAVALAKSADTVVLALGNSREQEHEGIDRADISFPDNQVQIKKFASFPDGKQSFAKTGSGHIRTKR